MPSRPRVFVTRSLPGADPERIAAQAAVETWPEPEAPSPAALRERVAGAAGLLCLLTDRVDAELLDAAGPGLKVVSSCSVGVDHIDLAAASARGVRVGHTPGVLTETTADLAFGLLLAAARRIPEAERFLREGHWTPERAWEPTLLLGRDVHGATLGLVGLGPIALAVARRAQGFGMRVRSWTRSGRAVDGIEAGSLDTLLAESDFVSIHVALAAETRNLIDAAALARMGPDAVLINTARGGIVHEGALVAALQEGRLAAAGLDVFEDEPLPPAHPLRGLSNVVLTPHIGSASEATRRRMVALSVDNLLAGLAGAPLPHCANPA